MASFERTVSLLSKACSHGDYDGLVVFGSLLFWNCVQKYELQRYWRVKSPCMPLCERVTPRMLQVLTAMDNLIPWRIGHGWSKSISGRLTLVKLVFWTFANKPIQAVQCLDVGSCRGALWVAVHFLKMVAISGVGVTLLDVVGPKFLTRFKHS